MTELIRREVNDRVANKATLDAHIFDEAQKEVEDLMRDSVYVNFLNSDVYLSYIQVRFNDKFWLDQFGCVIDIICVFFF